MLALCGAVVAAHADVRPRRAQRRRDVEQLRVQDFLQAHQGGVASRGRKGQLGEEVTAALGPGQLVGGWGGRGVADVVGDEADWEPGRGLHGYEDHIVEGG